MKGWRLIEDSVIRDGAWNMAVDEVLYREIENGERKRPSLRVYEWSKPCLSLGYHQKFEAGCDDEFCKRHGIDIVRRPTGGRAVLHADEVTYSVVGSLSDGPFNGLDLMDVYLSIAAALEKGLARLGLEVAVSRRPNTLSPASEDPCFASPSSGEILVGGRKVVGSAQRRGAKVFLQHGAIPVKIDFDLLARATCRRKDEARHFQSLFIGVGSVNEKITRRSLKKAVVEGFEKTFDGPWREEKLDVREKADAALLRREKYLSDEWTAVGATSQGMKPSRTEEF